jgi:putative membrane protein
MKTISDERLEKRWESDLDLQEQMSIERTKLSNERTFLSYLRTSLALLGAGLTIIRLEALEKVYDLGMACLILSPLVMGFAIFRFVRNKKWINKFKKRYRS